MKERLLLLLTHRLTPLGRFIKSMNVPINIYTFGGWSKERLGWFGFRINNYISIGEGYAQGLVDDECRKKIDGKLVDNEDHPSSDVIKVGDLDWKFNHINKVMDAREKVTFDVDGTLLEERRFAHTIFKIDRLITSLFNKGFSGVNRRKA